MILRPDRPSSEIPTPAEEPLVSSSRWQRIARLSLGILLLIGGLVGLVLPILQGTLLIVAAFAILRKDWPWAARVWDRWILPMQYRLQRLWARIRPWKE